MGKMYTITEDNYMEILFKLQKVCNKFALLRKQQCFRTLKRNKKENYSNMATDSKSWGERLVIDGKFSNSFKKEKYSYDTIVLVKKHPLRCEYEENPNSYSGKNWLEWRLVIRLEFDTSEVLSLSIGDKIKFEKWGFITYQDNTWHNVSGPILVSVQTFIVNRNHKITNLEEEFTSRRSDAEITIF